LDFLELKRLTTFTTNPVIITRKPIGKLTIKNHKYPPPPEPSSNMEPSRKSEERKAAMMGRTAIKNPINTKEGFLNITLLSITN